MIADCGHKIRSSTFEEDGECYACRNGWEPSDTTPLEKILDRNCETCGAGPGFQLPVWENMDVYEHGGLPDYVACTECLTLEEVDDGLD